MNQTISISKSDYLTFLEAPRHLWAIKHQISPLPFDPLALHQMEDGKRVERLAFEFLNEKVKNQPDKSLFYQQDFSDGPFHTRVDFLIYDLAAKSYELIEVKSSTKTDKDHVIDLAFQLAILEKELKISRCTLMHLNPEYRRHGKLDPNGLFILADLTREARAMLPEVFVQRQDALATALEPDPKNTAHCLKPKDCPYPELCHPDLPEQSIYDIPRIFPAQKKTLLEMGIIRIEDIPSNFKLNEKQTRVVDCVQHNRVHLRQSDLSDLLSRLEYPLWFLDYESCISAIPLFEGHWPQQQILFQYSLHKLVSPNANLEHFEYLADHPGDPNPDLIAHLKRDLGDTGSILVWNAAFEKTRHKDLMKLFPQHTQWLEKVNDRIFDLMDVVNQHYYYHPRFKGSASIKKVLPVLIPDLSYERLPIHVGSQASVAWWQMNAGEIPPEKLPETLRDLLRYCHLDTLAMVRLLEFFQSIAAIPGERNR